MHSDQIEADAALVGILIRDQFPQFRNEDIVALNTTGTTNAIFRIGSAHVARLPLRLVDAGECERLLEVEIQAVAEFNSYCPFASPKPTGMGRPSPAYPWSWSIQTWIEGTIATPGGLSDSRAFALDLAQLLSSLRAADLRGRAFDGRGRGGNLRDHDEWMEQCFSQSEHLLDVARLRNMWAAMRDLPSPGYEVMSHKDLIPANLLVDGEHLIGVLDTGAFGPADPALDLVAGWHLLDRDRRAVFREALRADALEWRRGAAWAFQQAMGLVWYYVETNPAMSELGRITLSRLIEDGDE